MIYKFKSKAASDLVMLGPQAEQILRIVGKEPSAQGIFEVNSMPAAIKAIEQAVAAEEAAGSTGAAGAAPDDSADRIGLRPRAWPFLEMLKRCHAEGAIIVWGV
ncbi:MAG: hypothetical protein CFE40_11710 [Burkholderiales bacterium PBB1]|nr:MAG: hypothetical protein CFE40_11710 [Burkholderiales bacterium PBB1]